MPGIPLDNLESLSVYVPMDRRQALARKEPLPELSRGAALFADISGFTPLTEALAQELGARHGAEELTRHLNQVYDALILELHRYRGSVIGFSGDAITCWLEGDDGRRATACALAMQQAMGQFSTVQTATGKTVSLAVKAAVSCGDVRRFLVGDPDYLIVDTIAGATLDHLAAAEHQAKKGEVVLDGQTARHLGTAIEISEWRQAGQLEGQFAVVTRLNLRVPEDPWPALPIDSLHEDQLRPWLLPPVYNRLQSGQGEFLAELRPAVALFMRFVGVDYDRDEDAGQKLDTFMRQVAEILVKYDGSLIQLTIGDKGSYLYAAFGAPVAHEEDAVRATSAALELRSLANRLDFLSPAQIGITRGRMRTGAYGSATRRTYGVLGDSVNLAARLMQAAAPGQILASEAIQQETAGSFNWDSMAPIQVKGKAQPVSLAELKGPRLHRSMRLKESAYSLPLVGRQAELDQFLERLGEVLGGKGQVVAITAEAGIGKSRLAAELIRQAEERGFSAYAGECQSYGTHSSYLVWQEIWRDVFALEADRPFPEQIETLDKLLESIDPDLQLRLPLLSAVLNLPIPQNDLTRTFDAKLRKTSLESLLVDCLRFSAARQPMILLLEDCHWIDPVSADLLEVISRAIATLPIMIILTYRPLELASAWSTSLAKLPSFSEIPLAEFTSQEAEALIQLKMRSTFGPEWENPETLVELITTRAAGNPFYVEELINYLNDREIDPSDETALANLDLPTSLHSLILSRIDQLTESQKTTLKVASVIGRLFKAALVWGVYPSLGGPERVKIDLERLSQLDITPLDTPEPELTYLFKNVITQQVTYENLPFSTRARLHEQIGGYLEAAVADGPDQFVDMLAFHFGHSQNEVKKREYYLKAGEAAQADYSNSAAIDYYQKVLPLLPEIERIDVLLKLSQVLELVGDWQEAERLLHSALDLAQRQGNLLARAQAQTALGDLMRKRSQYGEAATWFGRARRAFNELGNMHGLGQILHSAGTLSAQQGDYTKATSRYERSLKIRQRLGDKPHIASLLNNLAILAEFQGDYDQARQYNEQALNIRRELEDRWAVAASLNNLGNVALFQGNIEEAQRLLEEAVQLQRQIGDRWYLANALNNLGNAVRAQGDVESARRLYLESLVINRELGDKRALAYLLEDMGCLAAAEGQHERAFCLVGAAGTLRESIGAPLSPTEAAALDKYLEASRQALPHREAGAARARGQMMSLEDVLEFAEEV